MVIVSKFTVSPAVYVDVAARILHQTYLPELLLIAAFTQAMPLAKWTYLWRHAELIQDDDGDGDRSGEFDEAFEASGSYKLARVLRQVGFLQAVLYASDVCLVSLKYLDFKFVVKYQAQQVAGSVITASWLAWNASRLKHHYLSKRSFSLRGGGGTKTTTRDFADDVNGAMTQNRFLNRLADVLIYACAGLTVIDLLGIEIGFALKSIFGLGSFGTLALSLASKDLAAEFVGGLMIQTSNFFDEGELVVLQDGTKGNVAKIGWLVSQPLDTGTVVREVSSSLSANPRYPDDVWVSHLLSYIHACRCFSCYCSILIFTNRKTTPSCAFPIRRYPISGFPELGENPTNEEAEEVASFRMHAAM